MSSLVEPLPIYTTQIIRISVEILSEEVDINSIFHFVLKLIEPLITNGFRRDEYTSLTSMIPNNKFIDVKLYRRDDITKSTYDFFKVRDFLMPKICQYIRENKKNVHIMINNY